MAFHLYRVKLASGKFSSWHQKLQKGNQTTNKHRQTKMAPRPGAQKYDFQLVLRHWLGYCSSAMTETPNDNISSLSRADQYQVGRAWSVSCCHDRQSHALLLQFWALAVQPMRAKWCNARLFGACSRCADCRLYLGQFLYSPCGYSPFPKAGQYATCHT